MGNPTMKSPVIYLTEQGGASFAEAIRRAGLEENTDLHILERHRTSGANWNKIVQKAAAFARSVGAKVLIVDTLPQFAGQICTVQASFRIGI